MLEIYYNSRDNHYKSLFGAVKCDQTIEFRLKVQCDAPVSACICFNDEKINMHLESLEYDVSVFKVSIKAPVNPGLSHYHFIVSTPYHTVYYGNAHDMMQGEGVVYKKNPKDYQLTVYHDFSTPSWAKGRIMYQIFPDRFFYVTRRQSRYWDRFFHENWYDDPYIEQDYPSGTMENSDFFGGTLEGITRKLDYIKSLGIGIIYLNPINLAYSNHRYDIADYKSIDDTLGSMDDLRTLCSQARKRDIYIVLDMVFSHSGSDSKYFNKNGTFNTTGAYQDKKSEYYSWYNFKPDGSYDCWWGIETLPDINETEPSFMKHVFESIEIWINAGVKGFRLDVADELPGFFIKELRKAIKKLDSESLLIGEVWEDASNKVAYGELKEYLSGHELDSVMNYPYRTALLDYTLNRIDANAFVRQIEIIRENYPENIYYCLMNMLGTHDVSRILSLLGNKIAHEHLPRHFQKNVFLTDQEHQAAIKRLNFILHLLIMLPGIPSVYYADEAGLEGLKDPFNRKTYPWGREDNEILDLYKTLLNFRYNSNALKFGSFSISRKGDEVLICRQYDTEKIIAAFNNKAAYCDIQITENS